MSLQQNPKPILKIRQISIRTHAHATESIEKVKSALQNLIPFALSDADFHIETLSGSFSNPIRSITVILKVKDQIMSTIAEIGSKLSSQSKMILARELESRIDEKYRFYMRLDKQELFFENIELAKNPDVFQIVIAIQNKNPQVKLTLTHIKDYFEELNLIPI